MLLIIMCTFLLKQDIKSIQNGNKSVLKKSNVKCTKSNVNFYVIKRYIMPFLQIKIWQLSSTLFVFKISKKWDFTRLKKSKIIFKKEKKSLILLFVF